MKSNSKNQLLLPARAGLVTASESVPLFAALARWGRPAGVVRVLFPVNVRRAIKFAGMEFWIYILDPSVPPGADVSHHRVDMNSTTVIRADHKDVLRAREALHLRMTDTTAERRTALKELIFARKVFLDEAVPDVDVELLGSASKSARSGANASSGQSD